MTHDELARIEANLLRWEGMADDYRRYRHESPVPAIVAALRKAVDEINRLIAKGDQQ